jgi:hypothetical protein
MEASVAVGASACLAHPHNPEIASDSIEYASQRLKNFFMGIPP